MTQKNKRMLMEGVGFFLEMVSFIMAGVFMHYSLILYLLLGTVGLVMAIVVGKLIKQSGREDAIK